MELLAIGEGGISPSSMKPPNPTTTVRKTNSYPRENLFRNYHILVASCAASTTHIHRAGSTTALLSRLFRYI